MTSGSREDEADAEDRVQPSLPRSGDVVAGRYEIQRPLGTGATGHVFLAMHTSLRKQVAIKVLTPKAAEEPEQAERFLREAQAVSGLRHPRIVEITDFGSTDDGLPFFVMEYLAGEDLAASLARAPRLPWQRARTLMLEILDGLACAHENGVVHRDLKPENILLVEGADGGSGTSVKLVDFGIAKLLTETEAARLTNQGRILGTPHYMSPEQAVGKHVDARSDLYACGILLFEMLTGSVPFSEGSTMAILSQQITQAPPTLASAAPDLELDALPELEAIVARALHKDPGERYASAEELADAIGGVGQSAAAVAAPAGLARWWLPASVVVLLAGVGAVWAGGDPVDREAKPTTAEASALAEQTPTPAEVTPAPAASTPARPKPPAPVVEQPSDESGDDVEPEPEPVAKRPKSSPRPQPKPDAPAPVAEPSTPERVTDAIANEQLQRAASKCSAFVSRGGQNLEIEVNIAADGDVYGAVVRPPYGGDHPLGRCVAKRLNAANLPAASQGRAYRGTIRLVQAAPASP